MQGRAGVHLTDRTGNASDAPRHEPTVQARAVERKLAEHGLLRGLSPSFWVTETHERVHIVLTDPKRACSTDPICPYVASILN